MNIILNIPHANSVFPSVSEKEKWEDKELLEAAIKDWTDWFTNEVFIPRDELREYITPVIFPYSRFFMDMERLVDDPLISIGQGITYTNFNGNKRDVCQRDYMPIYYEHIGKFQDLLKENCLLIDCHSFPNSHADVDICIGYNDDESYSEEIVSIIEKFFIGSGYTVARNTPYSNSLTPCKPINYKSVMIELNKRIYMNEDTITPNENYTKLKEQINELYKKLLNLQRLAG